jgi:AbrB family looped-hinge helix DNA binding protein
MGMLMNGKGQITVPAMLRAEHGWQAGDEFEFIEEEDGRVFLKPVTTPENRADRIVKRMLGAGTANMDKSTDELMEMLRGE